jgi:hypothetical protein
MWQTGSAQQPPYRCVSQPRCAEPEGCTEQEHKGILNPCASKALWEEATHALAAPGTVVLSSYRQSMLLMTNPAPLFKPGRRLLPAIAASSMRSWSLLHAKLQGYLASAPGCMLSVLLVCLSVV